MIALFDHCFNKSALHKNYVQAVADVLGLKIKFKLFNDLDQYYENKKKLNKLAKV